jgi:DUF4097 and DUF4098 domain-containing protein YvlB
VPDFTFDTPEPVDLRLRCTSGTVSITAADIETSTVEVSAVDDEARDLAENTTVKYDPDRRRLSVETPDKKISFSIRRRRLSIKVTVPTGSALQSRTASAEVTATGRYASAVAHTASGEIRIDTVDGDVEVHCASGDVTVGSGRAIRVHSASGKVRIDHATGEVDAHCASGQIRVGIAEAGVSAKTASGDITVEDARSGMVALNAASGDLTIGVHAGVTAHLDVNTVSGRVRSDLPVEDDAPAEGGPLVEVRARTTSGSVRIQPASTRLSF